MTHIWIQPYKNDILNVIDAILLLIMLMIVSLSAFSLSTSATSGVAITLMIAPLFLLFGGAVKNLLIKNTKPSHVHLDDYSSLDLRSTRSPK